MKKTARIFSALLLVVAFMLCFTSCENKESANASALKCTLKADASEAAGKIENYDELSKNFKENMIISEDECAFSDGESAFDILIRLAKDKNIAVSSSSSAYGSYIRSIAGISEFAAGDTSGWLYKVNGESATVAASEYKIKDGDVIEFYYSADMMSDMM